MGRFTDNKVQEFLATFKTVWLSLHHESPEISSPYSSEISGASYERVDVQMSQPESRYVMNATAAKFSGLPDFRLTHIGGWNSQFNGNMEFYIELETPRRIKLGGSYLITPGEIVLSID